MFIQSLNQPNLLLRYEFPEDESKINYLNLFQEFMSFVDFNAFNMDPKLGLGEN